MRYATSLFALAVVACTAANPGIGGNGGGNGTSPPNPNYHQSTVCGQGIDDVGCSCPTIGAMQKCWPGDPALRNSGSCVDGTQTCGGGATEFGGVWSPCEGSNVTSCGGGCSPAEFASCDSDAGVPPGQHNSDGGVQYPSLCQPGNVNNESEILVGYQPASGQSVAASGQIKVWITDEAAAIIAPGEIVDPLTGIITLPGDRTAKAPDGYLWEPALYIAPQAAESGGTPHFPSMIKGRYNNTTVKGAGTLVAGMDAPPAGSHLLADTTEIIWEVSSLGLSPGTYIAEFVIHDGDRDRGVGCTTLVIQ